MLNLVQRFEQSPEKQTSNYKLQNQNKLTCFFLDLESRAHISKEHFE